MDENLDERPSLVEFDIVISLYDADKVYKLNSHCAKKKVDTFLYI